MKNRTNRIVVFFIITIGLTFISIKVYKAFSKLEKDFTNVLPSTFSLPSEDSGVICKNKLEKLSVKEIFRDKNREPLSVLLLDKKYLLVIYKMLPQKDIPLLELLKVKIVSNHSSTGYSYRIIDNQLPFSYEYILGQTLPIYELLLTLSGDSITEIQKDNNLVGYSLRCRNFSIRYSPSQPVDIFFEGKGNKKLPIKLLFVKKDRKVFLVLLSSLSGNVEIPNGLALKTIFPNCE